MSLKWKHFPDVTEHYYPDCLESIIIPIATHTEAVSFTHIVRDILKLCSSRSISSIFVCLFLIP